MAVWNTISIGGMKSSSKCVMNWKSMIMIEDDQALRRNIWLYSFNQKPSYIGSTIVTVKWTYMKEFI